MPAEKGDTRNLTQTPGVAERDPSWSPDGKTIAYFSDASGEYQLYLHDQTGFKPPTVIDLGPEPSFFYSPTWSPDSKHIAYTDKHLRLWVVDVPTGKPVLVDTGIYGSFGADFGAAWSPDSKWIAYHRDLDNQLRAIFLYSMETHKSTQVTDGMSDASSPSFDPNGKFLYFLASTDDGPSKAGIDLSSLDRAQTTAPYVVVLAADGASPVPPQSDDEKIKDETKKDADKKDSDKKDTDKKDADKKDTDKKEVAAADKPARIRRTRIKTRRMPTSRSWSRWIWKRLATGFSLYPFRRATMPRSRWAKPAFFILPRLLPSAAPAARIEVPGIRAIWRFTLEKRKPEQVLSDLDAFTVSYDGSKVLYAARAAGLSPRPTT